MNLRSRFGQIGFPDPLIQPIGQSPIGRFTDPIGRFTDWPKIAKLENPQKIGRLADSPIGRFTDSPIRFADSLIRRLTDSMIGFADFRFRFSDPGFADSQIHRFTDSLIRFIDLLIQANRPIRKSENLPGRGGIGPDSLIY